MVVPLSIIMICMHLKVQTRNIMNYSGYGFGQLPVDSGHTSWGGGSLDHITY